MAAAIGFAFVLVAVFLLAYVVPRFAAVYQDLGRELPWITQLMLGWGRFLDEHAALATLATLVAGAGAGYALSRPSVRAALLREKPKPTDADISAAITNICRCGTFQQVREAIHTAAKA